MCEEGNDSLRENRAKLSMLVDNFKIEGRDRAEVAAFRAKCAAYERQINIALKTIALGHKIGVFNAPRTGTGVNA